MHSPNRVEKLERFGAHNSTAAESREASQREVENAEPFSSRQQIISWVCCLIAAGIMIETLFYKFTGAADSKHIFHKMGTEPWMRWVQGVWELLASICLLWPRMKWAGGILRTGAMLPVILSHMIWLGYSIQGDHGLLFSMAPLTFTCGVTVMWMYRHHIPGYVLATTY